MASPTGRAAIQGGALPLAVALMLVVSPQQALPQSSPSTPIAASVPSALASAPAARPAPRPQTPVERRDSATEPGDLRPERPVVPQVTIPLGKGSPVAPKPPTRPGRRSQAASAAGIDDAVARCEAQSDARQRADCRAALADRTRRR